ncbi:hypothetical protein GGS21DRAFT_509754 [Xylaria nigripes]|nr:hypothetical protein GGS21DRAFT_509754 [Xylaria nigripes]
MKHDMIVGKKYLAYHDVLVYSRHKRLLFPSDWPEEYPTKDIRMDEAGQLLVDPS